MMRTRGGRATAPGRWFRTAAGCLLAAVCLGWAETPTGYRVDHWDTSEGLPARQIRELVQTPDGYLWLATTGGLVRFDGNRFQVHDRGNTPGLPSSKIQSIYWSRSGELWFGGEGFLMALRDGEAVSLGDVPGLVHAMAEDPEGRLWILWGAGNLARREGGAWTEEAGKGAGFLVDASGDLLVRLADGTLARAVGGRLEPAGARQVVPDSPLWVLRRRVLSRPSRGEALASRKEAGRLTVEAPGGGTYAFPQDGRIPWLVDRHGNLWVTDDALIEAYREGSPRPFFRHVFDAGTLISVVREDSEGNLWLGTRARGLYRLRPDLFRLYDAEDAQLFRQFFPAPGGEILVYSSRGVYRLSGDRLVPFRPPGERLPVLAFHRDADGGEWFSSPGRVVRRGAPDPPAVIETGGVSINDFLEDPTDPGRMWARDQAGIFELRARPGRGEVPFRPAFPGVVTRPRVLFADASGRVWIATLDGVHRIDPDGLKTLGPDDGFPDVQVRSIHQTADGALWFGTYGSGLLRLRDGAFRRVDSSRGLAEDYVYSLLEDGRGNLWMTGNRGVHRASLDELNALLDGERPRLNGVHYGNESGLMNPEEGGDLGYAAPDGRLWFSTHRGLASVDPELALELTRQPPPVHIEDVVVEGVGPARREDGGSLVALEPSQRRGFTVEYTGIWLRDPGQLSFEYRLDGVDPAWIPAGRERKARYTHVPPGRHVFRVRAMTGGAVWSDAEDILTIRAQPFVYETAWFRLLVLAVLAGLATLAYRTRVRGLRRREVELNRTVEHRTRDLAVERDRAEAALREVEDARNQLEAQAHRLRELDEVKSRFFANVSHEFRTPLTLLLGPLEDLLDGASGDLPPDVRGDLELAASNAQRLQQLVNQLLDLARLESGRMSLQAREEDLGDLIRRLADGFVPLAERRGIAFTVAIPEEPVAVHVDPEQMEKVLVNLLGNAFKFTPRGERIEVNVRAAEPGWAAIEVRDTGPGIPEEQVPHVFDRFFQVDDSSTRRQPGTGIGLALVKELVELHHGTVSVESREGEGTTFRVRLRLGTEHLGEGERAEPEADPVTIRLEEAAREENRRRLLADEIRVDEAGPDADVPSAHEDEEDADRTTVLIVDDNPDLRRYLRRHLLPSYRVREAADGRAALDSAREVLPDLVVADVMMPVMDGMALCDAIKTDPELDFIPVILLTARASEESKLEGLATGADDYLTKPFSTRELSARIENLIRQRRRLRERFAAGEGAPPPEGPVTISDGPGEKDRAFLVALKSAILAKVEDEELTVEDLAREVGQSRRTLYRRVEELTGTSPMALIWKVRLEEAARLLSEGAGNVGEVGYAVGFRSVSHFSRKFREHHGESPSAWRARHAPRS